MSLYVLAGYWETGYAQGEDQSAILAELQKASPSAVIELFELQLNQAQHGVSDTYRFHAGTSFAASGNLFWAGDTYLPMPVMAEGFEYTGNGQLPRPRLRVSNIMGTITALLLTLPSGLEGAKVTRIRTLARYLDNANFPGGTNPYGLPDATAELPREVYTIDRKVTETRDVIEFEMVAAFDLQGVRVPKRQTIQNICQWRYRSWNASTSSFDYTNVDCPYISSSYFKEDDTSTVNPAEDVCSKRLSSCEKRFGSVTIHATATNGSATLTGLTTAELNRIGVGDPISGFGLPTGTTITSKTATTLGLSQAAVASTLVATRTGTVAATGLTITMGSVTGLAPGMEVVGPYVPTGARIGSINTTTKVITLNISDNPTLRGSAVTRTGTYSEVTTGTGALAQISYRILLSDTSGIQVNDLVVSETTDKIYAKTKVSSISTNALVVLSKAQAFDTGKSLTVTFYRPITPTSSSYDFLADDTYVVRPTGAIPFGSFPGVGAYR